MRPYRWLNALFPALLLAAQGRTMMMTGQLAGDTIKLAEAIHIGLAISVPLFLLLLPFAGGLHWEQVTPTAFVGYVLGGLFFGRAFDMIVHIFPLPVLGIILLFNNLINAAAATLLFC